ncbi:P-loop containing nucleoside triphosphate hydrolase protein, partial [Morchella conica CCBAS932]
KELYQKAQPPPPPPQPTRKSKSRAAAPPRSTTPTSSSLSDNDATSTSASNSNSTSTTTTAAKKKKQPATARPKRRPKDDPDGDFSAAKPRARRALVPRKKAVKPLQKDKDKSKDTEKKKEEGGAMAETPFLTPTSSPPAMDCGGGSGSGDDMDVDVDMDEVVLVGRSRRKRRRKTPVDDNVREVAPPSSPAVVAQMGALAVSPRKADAFGVLMGKRSSNAGKVSMAEQEDAEDREGEEEEDEPMLPLGVPEAAAVGARKRIPVSWDSETGMLTIRSSPGLLPSSPALGPVDVLDLAAGSDCEAEGKEGGEGRALRGLGRRKRTTARYDPGTGILSIKSSPILAAESAMDAVPDSDFCLLDYEQPQPQEEEGKELPLPLPLPPPPPPQQGESQVETSQPENTAKRTSAKYDTATGLLVISSPVLGPVKTPELRPKSAFSLLGKKKKEPPPPPQSAPAISAPQTAAAAPAQEPLPTVTVRQAPKKVAGSQTGKSVHPFFKPGGIKKVPDPPPLPQSDAEEEVTTATSQPQPARSAPTTTTLSAFATTAKIAAPWDTPWPTRANNHIRALPSTPLLLPPGIDIDAHLQPADRKRKERAVVVSGAEDLLHQLARTLRVPRVAREVADRDYYTRRYYDVPEHVRLPARIVMTGSELQSIVRGRVASRLPHPNAPRPRPQDDGREKGGMGAGKVHPALLKLYWRLQSELTPFDVSECETSCWEVKYAPECAAEVLQTGRETQVLRDWLRALKVESVAPAAAAHAGSRAVKRKTRGVKGGAVAKKRRRRKEAELSDFVIDSEEERDEMNEISDAEESNSGGGGGGVFGVKRSTIRAGDKGIECPFGGPKELGRLVNAVVISGPSGCGKTAAVYAVAREAGFEVFEVSPGMRRNGKDIVDQVGEMSRTHLVHQAKAAAPEAGAFFKPKTAAQKEKLDEEAAAAGGTKAPAQQQQSLILIEEADVLFDEDKNFWSSVQTLMAQSKRPIVFTCNDESLLPISSLSLHAVLRFTPPPRDLLVDNLMLVCANEGHLLERGSVHSLVVAKGDDMRAALVELEFWCRLGLGDRKGGLDWMVMRWPEGVDVAANGERMRVVSEGTYLEGVRLSGWGVLSVFFFFS